MRILWLVELLEDCVYRSDDLEKMSEKYISQNGIDLSYPVKIAVREESRTTSDHRSASLPPRLGGYLDRRLMNALSDIRLLDRRLQSTWTEYVFERHCNVKITNQSQGTNAGNVSENAAQQEKRDRSTIYICTSTRRHTTRVYGRVTRY